MRNPEKASGRLRIVMLTPYPPMCDGIGDYAHHMVSRMESLCDFQILTPGPSEGTSDTGITIRNGWDKGRVLYPFQLARTVQALAPQAVHVQHVHILFGRPAGLPLTVGLFLLSRRGLPVVTTLHNVMARSQNPRSLRRWLEDAICALSTHLTCYFSSAIHVMKQADADLLVEELGIPQEKITVVPYAGRFLERRSPKEAKEAVGLEGHFVVGCFGFSDPGKGFDRAIQALRLLRAQLPSASLLFVGGHDPHQDPSYARICRAETERLRALAVDLGLGDTVRFQLGVPSEALAQYLSAVDVFWFPYLGGGGASAALHAVARMMRPVVVTSIPKFGEIIDGKNGLRVPPDSPGALANATHRLQSNPGLASRISEGLAATLGTADDGAIAGQMLTLYREALGGVREVAT